MLVYQFLSVITGYDVSYEVKLENYKRRFDHQFRQYRFPLNPEMKFDGDVFVTFSQVNLRQSSMLDWTFYSY